MMLLRAFYVHFTQMCFIRFHYDVQRRERPSSICPMMSTLRILLQSASVGVQLQLSMELFVFVSNYYCQRSPPIRTAHHRHNHRPRHLLLTLPPPLNLATVGVRLSLAYNSHHWSMYVAGGVSCAVSVGGLVTAIHVQS